MTRLHKILIAIFTGILLLPLSCKESEIAENITLKVDFVFNDSGVEFSQYVDINAYDESQVLRTYNQNITGIKVTGINCYMTYFTGPAGQQINSGNLEVADRDGSGPVIVGSLKDENLQVLLYQYGQLVLKEEGVTRLEKLIKNDPHEFRLKFSGISNLSPNEYTLTMEIQLKMIAIPL